MKKRPYAKLAMSAVLALVIALGWYGWWGRDKVWTLDSIAGVSLEFAYTPAALAKGLMFREHLPTGHGMLFVFDDEKPRTFYMKNCFIDLDIIFMGSDGRIVNITTMKAPVPGEELIYYPSNAPARYALEVPAGRCEELGVRVGERIDIPPEVTSVNPIGR